MLCIDEFLRVSHYETTKEMWDTLQVNYQGTTKVKRTRMTILIHEYELLRTKPEENIHDIEKKNYSHCKSCEIFR